LSFEGEPVASPPPVSALGGAGAEALFLLAQMVDRAELGGRHAGSLKLALRLADKSIEPVTVSM
jgi:hypothetical protein